MAAQTAGMRQDTALIVDMGSVIGCISKISVDVVLLCVLLCCMNSTTIGHDMTYTSPSFCALRRTARDTGPHTHVHICADIDNGSIVIAVHKVTTTKIERLS